MSSVLSGSVSPRPNPLILPMVMVSIFAVAEAVAVVILVAILAGHGPPPRPVASSGATGDVPKPAVPALAPAATPAKASPMAAEAPRGKRGQRVESSGFGITVEKIDYEPTYKDIARVGADHRYLALLIRAENNTGGNAGFFPAMFRVQDDQGYEYEPLALRVKVPGLEWRTMGNRESLRGYIDFVVPKSAKGLILIYSHLPGRGSQPIRVELAE